MIRIIQGDITKIAVDAIVNAANSSLLGGGGVDGAIHRAGGQDIYDEGLKIRNQTGGCPAGKAVITGAGRLPSKYVIHAVGPVWHGGLENEDVLLADAYVSSLRLAVDYNISSISFPNISTGIYGFPKERAARIALLTVSDFIERNGGIKEVIFVCYDTENYDLYLRMHKGQ